MNDKALALLNEDRPKPEWRRSRKGNLYCRWGLKTYTVYQRPEGTYAYCIADSNGPTYSSGSYATEAEALTALLE